MNQGARSSEACRGRQAHRGLQASRGLQAYRGLQSRGFTLVELLAVVTIMGVLATIAIYSMRKYIQHAKTSEATEIVAAIKAGEEAYYDETFRYLSFSVANVATDFYPDTPTNASGQIKIQWGTPNGASNCTACGTRLRALGVLPAAPVLFRYSGAIGASGDTPSSRMSSYVGGPSPPFGATVATQPFYVINAISDLDGDSGTMTAVVGSNLMGDLYSSNVGE